LDGSAYAERALPLAAGLARAAAASLRLVGSAASSNGRGATPTVDIGAYLRRNRDSALYGSIDIDFVADNRPPRDLILSEASEPDAWAVVMSTHGRTGVQHLLLGSVAEHVLRTSPVPVYLLPPLSRPVAQHRPVSRVLVPTDGSTLAQTVLDVVTELAQLTHCEIVLFRALDRRAADDYDGGEFLGPLEQAVRQAGVTVSSVSATGDPASEIVAAAQGERASLIALATHGRSGLDRRRNGSVAEAILRQSTVPVMTFGPAAMERLGAKEEALSA
jgi:nucleotide-binding universal stress UspA family protein